MATSAIGSRRASPGRKPSTDCARASGCAAPTRVHSARFDTHQSAGAATPQRFQQLAAMAMPQSAPAPTRSLPRTEGPAEVLTTHAPLAVVVAAHGDRGWRATLLRRAVGRALGRAPEPMRSSPVVPPQRGSLCWALCCPRLPCTRGETIDPRTTAGAPGAGGGGRLRRGSVGARQPWPGLGMGAEPIFERHARAPCRACVRGVAGRPRMPPTPAERFYARDGHRTTVKAARQR